jgi:nuclear GTP-binding protein
VCKAAPIPGETKVWQYIHMTKRIYLIDCPGVVYANDGKDETSVVLRGVIRAEKLEDPEYYIPTVLERAKKENLARIYGIEDWEDHEDFLK